MGVRVGVSGVVEWAGHGRTRTHTHTHTLTHIHTHKHKHTHTHTKTWAAAIQSLGRDEYLQNKRLENNSNSARAGRTGTRLPGLGKVQVRWQDGVRFAESWLETQQG